MTYRLTRNYDLCVRCGNCEGIFPQLNEELNKYGVVFLSERKLNPDSIIHTVLESCYVDALILERCE